jgi:hypothetical protein
MYGLVSATILNDAENIIVEATALVAHTIQVLPKF